MKHPRAGGKRCSEEAAHTIMQPWVLLVTSKKPGADCGATGKSNVLSAQDTAPFLFPAQRPPTAFRSPNLLRGTDPVSNCGTFLAKITGRVSHSILPRCSASSKVSVCAPCLERWCSLQQQERYC